MIDFITFVLWVMLFSIAAIPLLGRLVCKTIANLNLWAEGIISSISPQNSASV